MTKLPGTAGLVLALGLACGPVMAQPKQATAFGLAPRVLSAPGFGIIPVEKCKGTPGAAVTVPIGSFLQQLVSSGKVTSRITRELPGGAKGDVAKPTNVGANWPTTLDMALKQPGFSNDYVLVTIELTVQRGVVFLRPYGSTDRSDSTLAVTVDPDTTIKDSFCGRTVVTETVNGAGIVTSQKVSFGVKKSTLKRAVNFGFQIPDNVADPKYWMPIILDPIVENEG